MRVNGAKPIAMHKSHKDFYEKLKRRHNIGHTQRMRLQILLCCHSGLNNAEVKRKLEVSLNMVKKWRSRWLSGYEKLLKLEGAEEEEYLVNFLKDNPRSGIPKKFSIAQEKSIVALACEKPEDHGVEMTDWSLEMLCEVAAAKGLVQSISTSQLSRLLKKAAITTP